MSTFPLTAGHLAGVQMWLVMSTVTASAPTFRAAAAMTPAFSRALSRLREQKARSCKWLLTQSGTFTFMRGVSAIDREGAPFCDEAADRALFGAIRSELDTQRIELVEMDTDVNDDRFADAMADRLHQLITKE